MGGREERKVPFMGKTIQVQGVDPASKTHACGLDPPPVRFPCRSSPPDFAPFHHVFSPLGGRAASTLRSRATAEDGLPRGPGGAAAPPYQANGANLQFTEPTPTGNKFYRLQKP